MCGCLPAKCRPVCPLPVWIGLLFLRRCFLFSVFLFLVHFSPPLFSLSGHHALRVLYSYCRIAIQVYRLYFQVRLLFTDAAGVGDAHSSDFTPSHSRGLMHECATLIVIFMHLMHESAGLSWLSWLSWLSCDLMHGCAGLLQIKSNQIRSLGHSFSRSVGLSVSHSVWSSDTDLTGPLLSSLSNIVYIDVYAGK